MKYITTILLITISSSAYSISFIDLKNMFNFFDNSLDLKSPKKNCCDPSTEEIQLMNQCAKDLCGDSGTVNSIYINNETFDQHYKNDEKIQDYQSFKPKLQKFIELKRKKTELLISKVLKSINEEPNYFDLNTTEDSEISNRISNHLSDKDNVLITSDENGKKAIAVTFDESEISIPEEVKSRYLEYKINKIKSDFSSGLYNDYLSTSEAENFLREAIDKINKYFDDKITLAKTDDEKKELSNKKDLYSEVKEKINAESSLGTYKLVDYYYKILQIDWNIGTKLDLDYYSNSSKSFDCSAPICKEYLLSHIKKMLTKENLAKIASEAKDTSKDDQIVDSCKYFWHSNELKKVKGTAKEDFKAALPEMIQNFENKFISRFSADSQNKMKSYLENLAIKVADDLQDNDSPSNSDNVQYLKDEVKTALEQKSEATAGSETDASGSSLIKDVESLEEFFYMGDAIFVSGLDQCEGASVLATDHFKPSTVDDETYIHASVFSCNHYVTGKQVFAHELGHAISSQFSEDKTSKESYAKYLTGRACVRKRYRDKDIAGEVNGRLNVHAKDTKYSEEDTADLIANIAENNSGEPLLSCSLLSIDPNKIDYKLDELNVFNPIELDTHSTAFLRTLMEAINKKRILSDSCNQIIEKYKDRINFNRCEF